jgi:hypothetical protein
MTIDHIQCPRCGIERIGNFGKWGRFCFNCRLHLAGNETGPPPARLAPVTDLAYQFSDAELARLVRYRAAIRAGFYTDWPDSLGVAAPAV